MNSHLLLLLLFSFLVALVFAMLLRDEPREQLRFGGMVFGGFVAQRRPARMAHVSVPASRVRAHLHLVRLSPCNPCAPG